VNDDCPAQPRRASRKELKARIAQLEAQLAASTYQVSLEVLSGDDHPTPPGQILQVGDGQFVQTDAQAMLVDEGRVTHQHVVLRWNVRRVG
jgi:hypothetical protein